MQEEILTLFTQAKPKMPFYWPTVSGLARWNPIPHRYRPGRRWNSRQKPRSSSNAPPPENITALQTSFSPVEGLRALRRHKWAVTDIQHLVTVSFLLFSFSIVPIPVLVKLAVMLCYSLLVLMPATRQFFFPSLPIWAYLFYFFSSR